MLDWGVPDIGALPPRDRRAQATWLAEVRRSLACFEPRLRDPELELQTGPEAGRSTLCMLSTTSRGASMRSSARL